jgi:hypothetical protein
VSKPLYKIWLTCEARADIAAWTIFIDSFNGKSLFMSDQWLSSGHLKLFTDAAGSLGFAAVLGHMWFAESWSSPLASYDITVCFARNQTLHFMAASTNLRTNLISTEFLQVCLLIISTTA